MGFSFVNFFGNGRQLFLRKQNSILSAAFVISALTAASRVLGLVRDRLLAGAFFGGNEWQLDVYFAAFRIPDMIFQLLVVGALSAAFIPIFSDLLEKNKQEEAYEVASSVINLGLVFFALLGAFIMIFAGKLSYLIAPTFTNIERTLLVQLIRLMTGGQLFFIISSFFTGILQSNQRFLIPAISPILYNLSIIAGVVFLAPHYGIFGPAIGVVLGALLHLVIQIPLAFSLGFRYHPFLIEIKRPAVREIGRLMLPRTIGLAVSQIGLTVDVVLATMMTAGSLSIFNFASHLIQLPVGLFGAPLGQAALPTFSKAVSRGENESFTKIVSSTVLLVFFLALPASMFLIILRVPLVRFAFGARRFPWEATLLTAKTVAFFAIAASAQSAVHILARAFYALKNTRTPLLVGAVSVFINTTLSIWLTFSLGLGVVGLALASSIASSFQALLLFFFLVKDKQGFNVKNTTVSLGKIVLNTLLMGTALWSLMHMLERFFFDTTRILGLLGLTLITIFLGAAFYLLLAKITKLAPLYDLVRLLKRLRRWDKILIESTEVFDASSKISS